MTKQVKIEKIKIQSFDGSEEAESNNSDNDLGEEGDNKLNEGLNELADKENNNLS